MHSKPTVIVSCSQHVDVQTVRRYGSRIRTDTETSQQRSGFKQAKQFVSCTDAASLFSAALLGWFLMNEKIIPADKSKTGLSDSFGCPIIYDAQQFMLMHNSSYA